MDTNRVRKLLEDCFTQGRETCDGAFCTGCWKDNVRAALAELDKTPKVLTNEEAGRITDYVYRNGLDGVPKNEIAMAKAGFNFGLRYARDNGYLAPAAELTVDEAMECVRKWIGLPFMAEDLHTRLTTKLNSKNNVY